MSDPEFLPPEVAEREGRNLVPLSEEWWTRVLRGKTRPMRFLVTEAQVKFAGPHARSCGGCRHTHLHGDPRRGWCSAMRMLTGITFPVLCRKYESS